MKTIGQLVYEEVEQSKNRSIKISDNYYFNQYQIIQKINSYLNSRYTERDNDAVFWNLSTSRVIHFAKNIDLDTKDLQPYGVGDTTYIQIFILKQKFYKWLEENKMAIGLNDMSEGIASYGSVIFKLTDNELNEVNLLNIFFDPTIESVRDTATVELHYLTPYQLKQKKNVWDNVDKILEEKPEKDPQNNKKQAVYEIWERWGEIEIDKKIEYKQYIGYGQGDKEIILFENNVKPEDSPYYDFHISKYKGRWMRVGLVERLFQLQVRANQLVNQNAAASEIASLLLLRTENGEQLGNVLNQVENGQIIQSNDLQQIGLNNTGLNQFINELQQIEIKADKLCLTPQIVQGDMMPSGTPFRSVAVVSNAAKSTFRYIKERTGETLGYILKEKIFPDIIKTWNKEEMVELAGGEEDIKYFDEQYKRAMKWKTFVKNLLAGNEINEEQLNAVENLLSDKKENKKIKIPKGFFDFKYKIRTNITGESVDKAQQNDAYFNALQMVQANPAIVNTPLFKQYIENNGINWWKMTPEQTQEIKQGSVPNTPIGGKQDKLLAQADTTQ